MPESDATPGTFQQVKRRHVRRRLQVVYLRTVDGYRPRVNATPSPQLLAVLARGVIGCHTDRRPCSNECTEDATCPRYRWAIGGGEYPTDQVADRATGEDNHHENPAQ